MAWDDIWKRLQGEGGLSDLEEYEEGGALANSASTPQKARLARASIAIRREDGPEGEREFKRSPEYKAQKGVSDEREDKMEKARAIAIIREKNRGLSTEEAAKVLEKFGGTDKFWDSMSMTDEEDRIMTLKEIEDIAKKRKEMMDAILREGD